MISCRVVMGIIFLGLGLSAAMADKIELVTGKSVEGIILSQDKDSVVIDTGIGTPLTYYRDEIANILTAPFADPLSQADKLENEAVALIDAGKRQEGLAAMRRAIELDPSPLRQMNYGSVLFGDGVEAYKKGALDKALQIFKACERYLKEAIAGFDQNTDGPYLSQCYFLLGEIYIHAKDDKQLAKDFYQKAASFYDHPAALEALQQFNIEPAP